MNYHELLMKSLTRLGVPFYPPMYPGIAPPGAPPPEAYHARVHQFYQQQQANKPYQGKFIAIFNVRQAIRLTVHFHSGWKCKRK